MHEKNYSPDCTAGEDEGKSGCFQCAVHLLLDKWNWHNNFFDPCIRGVLMKVNQTKTIIKVNCVVYFLVIKYLTKPKPSFNPFCLQGFQPSVKSSNQADKLILRSSRVLVPKNVLEVTPVIDGF